MSCSWKTHWRKEENTCLLRLREVGWGVEIKAEVEGVVSFSCTVIVSFHSYSVLLSLLRTLCALCASSLSVRQRSRQPWSTLLAIWTSDPITASSVSRLSAHATTLCNTCVCMCSSHLSTTVSNVTSVARQVCVGFCSGGVIGCLAGRIGWLVAWTIWDSSRVPITLAALVHE